MDGGEGADTNTDLLGRVAGTLISVNESLLAELGQLLLDAREPKIVYSEEALDNAHKALQISKDKIRIAIKLLKEIRGI